MFNTGRIAELIELRKLKKSRQGIDVQKLSKGDAKKKRKAAEDGQEVQGGLRAGARVDDEYVTSNRELLLSAVL